ncbi:MAG TPA: YetF domain-containing protein [Sphingomicrobium sp.]|nr:YetF domain-containing protein [Sphingomicrobium sp.]
MLFDGPMPLVRVLVISLLAYAWLIFILRVSGKRSLAKLNAFDFIVTVALGSTLAAALLNRQVSFSEGALAFVMLTGLQYAVTAASVRWDSIRRLVRSKPRLLLDDGRFLDQAMRDERLTRSEVEQAIRNQGIGRIEDVAAVVLETDGSMSVIKRRDDGAELTALHSLRRGERRS